MVYILQVEFPDRNFTYKKSIASVLRTDKQRSFLAIYLGLVNCDGIKIRKNHESILKFTKSSAMLISHINENRIQIAIRSVVYVSNSIKGTYFVQISRFYN